MTDFEHNPWPGDPDYDDAVNIPVLEGEPGDMGYYADTPDGRIWVKWDEPLPPGAQPV